MPGRGSYGPAGKWIHDRAHRIMESSPETPKRIAYATATQQAHKVGKSPKGFRTSGGVARAKAKFRMPKREYQKTASLAGLFDELEQMEKQALSLKTLQSAYTKEMGTRGLTTRAQKFARSIHTRQQAAKRGLGTAKARHAMMQQRTAMKPKKPGLVQGFLQSFRRPAPAGAPA